MFINRHKEMEHLNREYSKTESSFVVIYGRRRTGKTTLIKEFSKNKKAIYFFVEIEKESLMIKRFKKAAEPIVNNSLFNSINNIEDWDIIFDFIIEKAASEKEKVIIAIDEFQYIVKENPSFASKLQRIWDEKLKDKNIMLILCGSLIGMMYETALAYQSPLYGRRTSQINLKQIEFQYYNEFFSDMNFNDLVRYYSVTGGVPKYINYFKSNNLMENIKENILDKNSMLYLEPRFILNEEVSDTTTYFSILEVIAKGEHKLGNIAGKLGVQATQLTFYLKKLIELDIIYRKTPINETNPEKSKKGLYFIKDNFFLFWFRFVYPNTGYLEMEEVEYASANIERDLELHVSNIFEAICQKAVYNLKIEDKFSITGSWWDNNEEIDVVATGENGVLFGECKWSNQKVGTNILEELKRKSKVVKIDKNKQYFVIFSKSGFTDDLKSLSSYFEEGDNLNYLVITE